MLLHVPKLRPRVLWTLAFLGALVLAVNATIFLSIKTSQRFLDEELGKRLEGTAQIAGLLVRPEHFAALVKMADDAARSGAVESVPASEALAETAGRDSLPEPGPAPIGAFAPPDTNWSGALPDTATFDFVAQMDAIDAADAVRAEWKKLAEGAEASNVVLLDAQSRPLLRLRQPFAVEGGLLTLDDAALARALIGEPAHSALYEKDGQYLRSGYAPVFDVDGTVLGAVVVEGASAAFRPLTLIRTSLYGTAIFASLLVVLIGLGYVRTVGHLARIEANLRRTDLLASVGQVAAGVAHEIRNPLAVLQGAAARLHRGDALPAGERVELLRMIDEETKRMGIVVQNFLDLARGPKAEEARLFELKPVLLQSLSILRVELERSNVALEFEWNAPETLAVEGHAHALHHVFLNLALNARDVMPTGGRLKVRVTARRGEVRIYFEDTGPGVPPELRNKIFQPFFTTRATGTGLGLAFVDLTVSEHGGSVTVGSAPGGGAAFEIRLPAEVG
ncbi:MAG TPA: HAMP domain-containing sensor histidine kinase [Acidobacteriota bacterium]|nr:HAMP domain-containing sensor histidine kinase [Acidobacteriota bacterium]